MCKAFGDPQINMFDGSLLVDLDTDSSVLARANSGTCRFHLKMTQGFADETTTYIDTLELKHDSHDLKLAQTNVTYDGIDMDDDFEDDFLLVKFEDGKIEATLRCGVAVKWEPAQRDSVAMVIVAEEVGPSVGGLCGNCDRQQDDLDKK